MKIRSKPFLASLIAASLTLLCALKADGARGDTIQNKAGENDAGHNDAGMCRRAPAPILLAAEPPVTVPPSRLATSPTAPPPAVAAVPDLSTPPPPAPPPPPSSPLAMAPAAPSSGSSAAPEEVLITGALIRGAAAVGVPVTGLGERSSGEADKGSAFQYRGRRAPPPPAGLLTAGDHDDLLNPMLYARYVDNFLKNETLEGVPHVDTSRVLEVKVDDRSGRPVPFAPVTLTCADGNQLTLTTTANGSAVFFPQLDRLGPRVTISVPHDASQRARVIALSGRVDLKLQTVRVSGTAPAIERFDLALVVDTTGSMADELEYLKSELGAILADLNRDHPTLDVRVALVVYRDVGDIYVTRTFPFTSDIAALRADLSQQTAGGGGDYPEAVEQAMARAVALDWRPDAVRSILFVADAPPHADDVASAWQSTEVARGKRIHIVAVGASGVGPGAEYLMRAMAALTQSRYIFLTDDSGIGNRHAPPSVDCYLVTKLGSSIRRVLESQISGRRVEPAKDEIIRTVGDYDRGRCNIESQRR
jgi:hypothetical protein